jgi:hypothetical protein
MNMETPDWSDCPLVEIVPGKVSGAPLLKNTRLPVGAITGDYDAFRDEGLSPDAASPGQRQSMNATKAIASPRSARRVCSDFLRPTHASNSPATDP